MESLPTIVRAGAVVRVEPLDESGRGHGLGLATVDLRFSDGRMERWVGPGEVSGSASLGPTATRSSLSA